MAGTFKPEEFTKDFDLNAQLNEIKSVVNDLMLKLDSTLTLVGQDLIAASNLVYGQLQDSEKEDPTLTPFLDEMKPFYAKSKKAVVSPPPTPPAK